VIIAAVVGGLVVIGVGLFVVMRSRSGTGASPGGFPSASGGALATAAPPAAKQASPWQRQLKEAQRRDGFDWEYESAPARALVNQLLAQAAPLFGNAHVKERPDDGHIELRGTYGGAPIRFAIWMSFGTFWAIEMQCDNRLGEIEIERDHEKIPTKEDPQDPWSKDETRRIFLARGIFAEGRYDVEEKIAIWSKVPAATQAMLLEQMEALDARRLNARSDVSLSVRPGLRDLDDPIAYMQSCARVLDELKNAIAQGDRDPTAFPKVQIRGNVVINGVPVEAGALGQAASVPTAPPRTCKYCSSIFLLAVDKSACPNCGASATT